MKNILKIAFVIIVICYFGCEKNDEVEPEVFRVEVLGKGMDCGDLFLIKFDENDEERINKYLEHSNSFFPIFYASNLKAEHKEEGLFLDVTLGKCSADDIALCTAWGPGYSQVCVESSETIKLTFP